jgi:hypothetical protein
MEQLWSNGRKGRKRSAPAARDNRGNEPKTVANRCAYLRFGPHGWKLSPPFVAARRSSSSSPRSLITANRPWWLSVHPHDGGFVVGLHHVLDPCDPEFLDVTEFAPVDEWEYVGEGVAMSRTGDPEGALRDAGALGAVPERWVNEFVVAEEYRDSHGWTRMQG